MKHRKGYRGLLLSSVSAVALLAFSGCYYEERPAPPPGPVAVEGYDYYYYPDEEVYYYPVTGVYFWFGGGAWHHGARLPRTIVVRPDTRVTVRLNTRTPYEHHEEIRGRYPAHHAASPPRHEQPGVPGR